MQLDVPLLPIAWCSFLVRGKRGVQHGLRPRSLSRWVVFTVFKALVLLQCPKDNDVDMRGRVFRKLIVIWRWLKWDWRRHWFYLFCQLAAFVCSLWWLPWRHLPWPGVAIAGIAVLAALMSVHPRIGPRHKVVYFVLIALLLRTEYAAIRKDRDEAEFERQSVRAEEHKRLQTLLESERMNTETSTRRLLDQENESLSAVLRQDQDQFTETISTLLNTHQQDEREFASIARQARDLIDSQRQLSEQFMGRLIPGTDPVPENACTRHNQEPKKGQMLVIFGSNAEIVKDFPHSIVTLGGHSVLSVDRVHESNNIYLSLDFRDFKNRVIFRADKNGVVNHSVGLNLLHPAKSVFLLEDEYGSEFLKIQFVNPQVLKVTGKIIYCGDVYPLVPKSIGGACSVFSTSTVSIGMPACPKPSN
jgi:TusA-related sulfurtransferase